MRRSAWLLGALLSSGALTTPRAAELPDEGLLEFLGSVDSEDKGWHEYLARTDIDKVARRAGDPSYDPAQRAAPPRLQPADPSASPPPSAGKTVAQP